MSAVVERPASLEADWDAFCEIESEISSAEGEGIMARWRCGQMLLAYPKGRGGGGAHKKNPSPLSQALETLCSEFGINRNELYARRNFAWACADETSVRRVIAEVGSWKSVCRWLTGKGAPGIASPLERQIRELRRGGLLQREIAEVVGCNITAVRYHLDPKVRKRMIEGNKRRRKEHLAAGLALRQKRRAEAARRAGIDVAAVWNDIRGIADRVAVLSREHENNDLRDAMDRAFHLISKAEDEISKGLKVP